MTKTDLIAQVAANTEMSKKSAEMAVNAAFEALGMQKVLRLNREGSFRLEGAFLCIIAFYRAPPRRSGPRERAGFHGIPSLRWNKWQSSYKSNDTSFNIDCLPTWQSSPDWQTTYFASRTQVCHLGKVRFTVLVR